MLLSFFVFFSFFFLLLMWKLRLTAVRVCYAAPCRWFPDSGGRFVPPPGCGEPSRGVRTVRCVLRVSGAKTTGVVAARASLSLSLHHSLLVLQIQLSSIQIIFIDTNMHIWFRATGSMQICVCLSVCLTVDSSAVSCKWTLGLSLLSLGLGSSKYFYFILKVFFYVHITVKTIPAHMRHKQTLKLCL